MNAASKFFFWLEWRVRTWRWNLFHKPIPANDRIQNPLVRIGFYLVKT